MIGTNDRITIRTGQEIAWSQRLDSWRTYVTDAMKPSDVANILKSADQGEIGQLCELQDEMEGKDAHLQGVAARRREALTALEWTIEPCPYADDESLAQEIADYCQQRLVDITTWPETLEHLATAIGPGIACTELIWQTGLTAYELVATNDIPGHRLRRNQDSADILVETDAEFMGQPMPRGKYVVYTPNSRAGFPFHVTLTRAQAYLFLIRHMAIADWSAFIELFGHPMRVGIAKKDATPAERTTLRNLVRDMTGDDWVVFSEAADVKFLEASRGTEPYSPLLDWIERKTSILWLGQTLTTEMQEVGSFAAARVHENVRTSILLADIQNEARMIREQILRPMTLLYWPNVESPPIPVFKRQLYDRGAEDVRLGIEKLRAAQELGLRVDESEKYEALALPEPIEPEPGPEEQAVPPADMIPEQTE